LSYTVFGGDEEERLRVGQAEKALVGEKDGGTDDRSVGDEGLIPNNRLRNKGGKRQDEAET
jgi:hypothetical protein